MSMKDAVRHIKMAAGDVASDPEAKRVLNQERGIPEFGDPICEMILGGLVGRLVRLGASPEAIGRYVENTARLISKAVAGEIPS
jgi:hypothetical protein